MQLSIVNHAMLSNYTPYMQFVAAIYFSMCFEQLVEKFFWNKRHEEKIGDTMQRIEKTFGLIDRDKNEIIGALERKHDDFIQNVKRWSIGMLLSLIAILFFSGIESSSCFIIPHWLVIVLSILILFPVSYFFISGWRKTSRYVKKVNRIIDGEIVVFYENTQDCITGNKNNVHYTELLASVFQGIKDGDAINKTTILSEIIVKFKEESAKKIKEIICKS